MTDKQDKRLLTPEEILDDFARVLYYICPPNAEKKYIEARDKTKAQLAKVDKLKLARPDREKIAKLKSMIKSITALSSDRDKWAEMFDIIDQLALIPDEEEIRKQERERIIDYIEDFELFTNYSGDFRAVLVSELKKQALKGEK